MSDSQFRLYAVSDLLARVAKYKCVLVTHRRADPDALASLLFVRLLAMERYGVELDFTIDTSPILAKRLPHFFEKEGTVMGMPILSNIPEGRSLFLFDTCHPRMAFIPKNEGVDLEIFGSLDHHTTLENPIGLNFYLPTSSMSVVFAELGFILFPRDHAIWATSDWQYLAAVLALGIASDAGFTTPSQFGHIWNLSKLPLGLHKDLSVLHDLVGICPRSVLEEFEAAQIEVLSGFQVDVLRTINNRIEILNLGSVFEDQRDMVGAHVDSYLAKRSDLVGIVAFYRDGTGLRYSGRVRSHCSLLPQLTTALCGNRGSVKNDGQQAGGTILEGIGLREAASMCQIVGEDLICSHLQCGVC